MLRFGAGLVASYPGQERMRIIFVNRFCFPDQSATSQMVSGVAFSLDQHSIHLVCSRQRFDDPAACLPAYERMGSVAIHRVAMTRFGREWLPGRLLDYLSFYVTALWTVARLARRGDIVVVCTDPPLFSVLAAPLCRLRGARLVNWLLDLFPEVAASLGVVAGGRLGNRVLQRLRDATLRAAVANVVLGRRMVDYLVGRGIDRGRLCVIPNWADGQRIRPVPRRANALRSAWGIGQRFVVGYSGNLGRAHEFGTLMDAAAALQDRPDIVLLLIGNGHHRSWVEEEVRHRGLENVLMRPFQEESQLSQSLGVADLHIVSLRPALEGFIIPSKIYAITAAGRPALFIGDSDGEVAHLLAENDCGATVAVGDAAGLAAQIRRLADDPRLLEEWSSHARQAFDASFDRTVAVASWRALLDGLAPRPVPRAMDPGVVELHDQPDAVR